MPTIFLFVLFFLFISVICCFHSVPIQQKNMVNFCYSRYTRKCHTHILHKERVWLELAAIKPNGKYFISFIITFWLQFNRITFYVMLVESHPPPPRLSIELRVHDSCRCCCCGFFFSVVALSFLRICYMCVWHIHEMIFKQIFPHRVSIETFESMSFLHLAIHSMLIHHQTKLAVPRTAFFGCFSPFSFSTYIAFSHFQSFSSPLFLPHSVLNCLPACQSKMK